MEKVYKKFYRKLFQHTGGFVPTQPNLQSIYPGDFFQIINGEIMVLGNVFRKGVLKDSDIVFGNGISLSPAGWYFSEGMTKPFSGRGSGNNEISGEFEFSRQVIAFAERGSFIFRGNNPESVKILNWKDIQQELIIKMTQTLYSFRDLYIVTESATTSDWTLAISSGTNSELEIASDQENFGLSEIFGHQSAKTIQSRDIEFFQREDKRKPSYFKAKKLVIQDEILSDLVSDLIDQKKTHHIWANDFFEYPFQNELGYTPSNIINNRIGILDMMQANELNPNTALLFFKWEDVNLDDLEKLFTFY